LYSRNIARKFHYLCEQVKKLHNRLDAIEIQLAVVSKVTKKLGQACGEAFHQTKEVIKHLHEEQAQTREDLSEYGGVIQGSTWDINTKVV
jgi:histidinol dehydrogenase